MNQNTFIPEVLFYVGLGCLAMILLVGWLVYAARGGRAVNVSFKGLGMTMTVHTAPSSTMDKQIRENESDL